MKRIQFQPGMLMPDFFKNLGTEVQYESELGQAQWHQGLVCHYCAHTAYSVFKVGSHKTPVSGMSTTNFGYRMDSLPKHQATVDSLVLGDLPNQPNQYCLIRAGSKTVSGRQISNGMTRSAQAHRSYGRARNAYTLSSNVQVDDASTVADSAVVMPGGVLKTRCLLLRRYPLMIKDIPCS
jgi:hypothetical protein